MTSQMDIMDAIKTLTAQKLLQMERIYVDLVPSGFKRPCLLIQSVEKETTDAACCLVNVKASFTLTLFDETDDYQQSDTGRLLEWQQQAFAMFRTGILRVKDRALSVKAASGGRDWDKAYIDLQLEYFDDRDDAPDTTPLMETLETDMRLNEPKLAP